MAQVRACSGCRLLCGVLTTTWGRWDGAQLRQTGTSEAGAQGLGVVSTLPAGVNVLKVLTTIMDALSQMTGIVTCPPVTGQDLPSPCVLTSWTLMFSVRNFGWILLSLQVIIRISNNCQESLDEQGINFLNELDFTEYRPPPPGPMCSREQSCRWGGAAWTHRIRSGCWPCYAADSLGKMFSWVDQSDSALHPLRNRRTCSCV